MRQASTAEGREGGGGDVTVRIRNQAHVIGKDHEKYRFEQLKSYINQIRKTSIQAETKVSLQARVLGFRGLFPC